ncbi:hypothetical protein V6N11_062792 [Hibiscus sabdariffa]|uniref:KANL3/Tex30 alpha/beta hydrolase-like domain-containing protein n=1 Tax=Hibiscus sabdariffa TaxID=183260 RepID=A0ABR2NPJ7_9ROSI
MAGNQGSIWRQGIFIFTLDTVFKSFEKNPNSQRSNYLFNFFREKKASEISLAMASSPPSKRRRKGQTTVDGGSPSKPTLTQDKSSPVVVFAHGAGAPSSSDWMIRWKEMLKKALNAVEVVTFDYPYMSGGKRKAPPKAEKLVDFHSDVVKDAVSKYPGHPLILAGKSMGSRVSCMVAAQEDIAASLIVCLGYPLKGTNGAVRDETLLQLKVPVMFVQGTKDGLCPLEKLEAVRKKMKAMSGLHEIDGGDHSFKISKKHLETKGSTQEEAEDAAIQAIASFFTRLHLSRGLLQPKVQMLHFPLAFYNCRKATEQAALSHLLYPVFVAGV